MSRRIKELEPTLKEKGIEFSRSYDNRKKSRIIKIINTEKISSLSSYRSDDSTAYELNSGQEISNSFSRSNEQDQNEEAIDESTSTEIHKEE